MTRDILKLIEAYANDDDHLNSIVIGSFVHCNHLIVESGSYVHGYCDGNESIELFPIKSIEDVIEIFELAIPEEERTTNGAIYTPSYIRDYIVNESFDRYKRIADKKKPSEWLCADISCGCGAFLFTLAERIKYEDKSLPYEVIYRHLYGVDISVHSVERAKILLTLNALMHGETIGRNAFHIERGDALSFRFTTMDNGSASNGFDLIVGNPPYVRSKHIDDSIKGNLRKWSTSNCGNVDLYIPFFEIALEYLCDNGIVAYITVNTFMKAVNTRNLRRFFSANKYSLDIVNFGQELIFKKILVYTCIVFASRRHSSHINYVKASSEDVRTDSVNPFNIIRYDDIDDNRGWQLNESAVLHNIAKIEEAGPSLGTYTIKNGLATLANGIFIFKPFSIDDDYFHLQSNGKEYRIEKGICRDIIKPNILRSEEEIETKKEKIIFPYQADMSVIAEEVMASDYPLAYEYLSANRDALAQRDKGKGDYPTWYAFGRTQAINDRGTRLLFPYMSDKPHFVLSLQSDLLMYCGYALFLDDVHELKVLKRILESSTFDYYIRNTSKPYSANYFAYAKNYVKNFGVYQLSESQKSELLSLEDQESIDSFIADLYGIELLMTPCGGPDGGPSSSFQS